MQRSLRNLSRLAPLTPHIPEPAGERPARTTPDLKVESALYAALQFERQRNAALVKKYHDLDKAFSLFRAKGIARGISKNMKPGALDRAAQKGKGL
jgi:hypothetical protein